MSNEYPATEGQRMAEKARQQCNKLTAEEREELRRKAMEVMKLHATPEQWREFADAAKRMGEASARGEIST